MPEGDSARPDVASAPDARPGLSASQLGRIAAAVGVSDSPPDVPPQRFGPYRIMRQIGEGGMGVVYLAEQDEPLRRTVALKLIKPGMDSREVLARFAQERQALALMNHRHVAKVLDAGCGPDGRSFFVMEYVPGTPITRFCDEHCLNIRQRLELFAQACEAVQHAHQKAIIHRDLKPSNILVTDEPGQPEVKVIDFGVAKALDRASEDTLTQVTQLGQPVGTPQYMSPEQACGADVDTRSDIYSLGVVLYELLIGAQPFDPTMLRNASFDQIRRTIRDEDPPKPSARLSSLGERAAEIAQLRQARPEELIRQLRRELEWIPLKAMRKDRAQRYATTADLARDIAHYLDGRPLIAAPDNIWYGVKKYVWRRRTSLGITGAVALAVALAADRWGFVAVALFAGVVVAGLIGTTVNMVRARRAHREALVQRNHAEHQRAEAERQRKEAEYQQQEVKRQAAVTEAVIRFQSEMLASADPDQLLGDQVTVLQSIQAAVKELDAGKLKDQVLAEASVRETIGNTLRALGRFADAKPNLEKALELRRGALPNTHPDVAASLNSLAICLWSDGKLADAGSLLREALRIHRQDTPADDAKLATTLDDLGALLRHQGRLAEAEPLCREALEIRQRCRPDRPADVAVSLVHLGLLLQERGNLDEAESALRDSLDISRRTLPPRHPTLAWNLDLLALLLRSKGNLDEAEPLLHEALEIRRRALPAGHTDIARNLSCLALVLQDRGKLDEAEQMFREALTSWKAHAPGNADAALTLVNLAALLQSQSRLDESESLYREAMTIYRRALPDTHGRLGACLMGLGKTLMDLNRHTDAEAALLEAQRVLHAAQGVPAERRAASLEALIDLYTAWNKSEPGNGYEERASQWHSKLRSMQSNRDNFAPTPAG
jgi:serine/threonine protein kinase